MTQTSLSKTLAAAADYYNKKGMYSTADAFYNAACFIDEYIKDSEKERDVPNTDGEPLGV